MKSSVSSTVFAVAIGAALTIGALAPAGASERIPAVPSTDFDKCQAAKTKASGDFLDCRQTAEAKFIKSGDATKRAAAIAKCTDKLTAAFAKAENAADRQCPTLGDADEVEGLATQCSSALTSSVDTGGEIPNCGDGVINSAGEHCDAKDLGGATCASLAHDIGSLGCTEACKFDASGCSDCGAGSVGCEGACVDPLTDNDNCGQCGTVCEGGQFCEAGQCSCATGESFCSGVCVDTDEDESNCGECGTVCGETETCVDGTCEAEGGGCDGFEYGGACWYLAYNQNCTSRCEEAGKVVDDATATVAGHLGTNAACEAVLTGLGRPGKVNDSNTQGMAPCYSQYECHVTVYEWPTGPTRCTATFPSGDNYAPNTHRACACE